MIRISSRRDFPPLHAARPAHKNPDTKLVPGSDHTLYTAQFFSHPDFTVGSGISPDQPPCTHDGSRTIPPVGTFTRPRRIYSFVRYDYTPLPKIFQCFFPTHRTESFFLPEQAKLSKHLQTGLVIEREQHAVRLLKLFANVQMLRAVALAFPAPDAGAHRDKIFPETDRL